MSTGFYGSVNLANSINSSSVDIFYYYVASRNQIPTSFLPLFPSGPSASDLISVQGSTGYSLRLPANVFNQLGFYVVTIAPKSYLTTVISCANVINTSSSNSTSSVQISKNGIVIAASSLGSNSSSSSGSLTGYKIQYFDQNNSLLPYSRIITSSDLVSPSNSNSLSSNNASFVLDPSGGSYLFLTLSPDIQSLLYSSQQQLGQAGQSIILSNSTLFDPQTIEIEMVDQTLDTLAIALYGSSTRDLGNGQYTLYDSNGNLYAQYLLAQTKNTVTNAIVEFKQQIPNPAPNQTFLSTTQGL